MIRDRWLMVSPVFVSQYQRGSECDILSISEIMCTQFCNYSENESRKTLVLLIVHQTHSVFGKDIVLNYYILSYTNQITIPN